MSGHVPGMLGTAGAAAREAGGDLPVITYVARDGSERSCPFRSEYDGKLRTCRCRGCPRCGPPWARDQYRNMKANLEVTGGPVVLLTITAPGEERLPWDDAHCAHRRRHRHRGPSGCRVQQRAAREWSDTLTWRWAKLRGAAQQATKRAIGIQATIHERAYEPQKRGVPHLHLVLGYGTPQEISAAHYFAAWLKARATDYDFGFVDAPWDNDSLHGVRLKVTSAQEAARYLASYLTGRSKKKDSIRENILNPVMPQSLVWLSPKLSRQTMVTMRTLRRARHLYAAAKGLCDPPRWQDAVDALATAIVYRTAYRRASEDDPPNGVILDIARRIDRDLRVSGYYGKGGFFSRIDEITDFAFDVAGLKAAA